MSKRFFTNEGENTLLKKFAGVFASNPDIERFDALVGYLRASGYFALRPHLEKVPLIRIIVGIDVDDQLARHHRKGLLMLGDADKTLDFVRKKLAEDVQGAPYRRDIEDGIPTASAAEQALLSGLVDGILAAKRTGDAATVTALESEIDTHVFRLYALTPAEIDLVKGAAK